ncbi:TRZ/ATZ family hydrolase [Candidatus Rariloculus sp.]|uniref:TRZ/ATZ family hydrolase n=1 Tax=Candidatus Rariloculus sp. TaxID=3101265 RepID=UPI003D0E0EF6
MQRIDALVHPKWTVTVEPEVVAESSLSLAMDRGRIIDVLPSDDARARYAPDTEHERPNHVLLPGLINAHCHAGMALFRGYADDLPLEQWLHDRIWPAESRWIDRRFVADGTRLAIAEMLLGGTTCFSDMYYFPDAVADTAIEAGIRCVVGMIALEFPTAWASGPDEYIDKGLAVHDRCRSAPLVTTAFAPHAPYSVSDETLQRIRRLADELLVPVHTHIHETDEEMAQAFAETGKRPLARLDALGLVTPSLVGVHATHLNDEEIDRLAQVKANIVHCPRSNLKLASGACPVDALLKAGVNVALGTDGAASNNRLDLWSELELAALFGKHVARDAAAVEASAVMEMATINGARALKLADETGSLVPGKAADAICVELSAPGLLPVLDPVSQLVYSASRDQVTDVWVAGEHLVSDGELTRMDTAAISASAHAWAERLAAT